MEKARPGKRMLSVTLVCALVGALGVACSSEETAKIGDPPDTVDRSQLPTYAGLWEGYVEAYKFFSGSDHVRLNLDAQGSGWLQVGDSADLVPAPTDPDVGWPPECVEGKASWQGWAKLLDGVRYPLEGIGVDAERIRFSLNTNQPYAAWCAMQKPVAIQLPGPDGESTRYACSLPGFSEGDECFADDPQSHANQRPIDCCRQGLCVGVCECDAKTCTVFREPGFDVTVDIALVDVSGSKLEGTILLNSGNNQKYPFTIRLKRK
jgi:hypothetical protein